MRRLDLGSSTSCKHFYGFPLSLFMFTLYVGSPGLPFGQSTHTDDGRYSCSRSPRWLGRCLPPGSPSSFLGRTALISVSLRSSSSCSQHSTRQVKAPFHIHTRQRYSRYPTVVSLQTHAIFNEESRSLYTYTRQSLFRGWYELGSSDMSILGSCIVFDFPSSTCRFVDSRGLWFLRVSRVSSASADGSLY